MKVWDRVHSAEDWAAWGDQEVVGLELDADLTHVDVKSRSGERLLVPALGVEMHVVLQTEMELHDAHVNPYEAVHVAVRRPLGYLTAVTRSHSHPSHPQVHAWDPNTHQYGGCPRDPGRRE